MPDKHPGPVWPDVDQLTQHQRRRAEALAVACLLCGGAPWEARRRIADWIVDGVWLG